MRTLTSTKRRTLRAKAHHLHPFVSIGRHGLTPAVLHEIDVNLLAHELIKIRVLSDDRSERETLLARICSELDAAPVQHLGKTLTIWRPAPEPETPPREKPAADTDKLRRARPRDKGAEAASKRRPARPRSDEPQQHYRAAPVAPDGDTPGNAPAGARSRRRKGGPRGDAVAQVAHPPRTRQRTSR